MRLVATARLRASVLADLVPEDMLDALAEIEGSTSGRLNGQRRGTAGVDVSEFVYDVPHAHLINASFSYAKPRSLNRFNGEDRGAWYAALEVETSLAEVTYHITRELSFTGEFRTVVELAEVFASFAGEFVDAFADPTHHCLNPDPTIGYVAGNAVAAAARAGGVHLIIYPSVRHEGGTCIAALSPHVVQSAAQGAVWRLVWNGTAEPDTTCLA